MDDYANWRAVPARLMSSSAPNSLRAWQCTHHRLRRETTMAATTLNPGLRPMSDLVCFSHLRWSWVYQRPQHLMSRAARDRRVFMFEEAIEGAERPSMDISHPVHNVSVATPRLPSGLSAAERLTMQRQMLDAWLAREGVRDFTLWFYTPMALPLAEHLDPECIVYDCMDELSAFAGAPPELRALEQQLFTRCDIVFTGGHSLHEAKRRFHSQVHAIPSSVDVEHFALARSPLGEPADQASFPHPRLGYCGVIDERLDLDLVRDIAAARPDWHLVFVGPVTKIDPDSLPRADNIHYLGGRAYHELPEYLSGWDVALLPFAHNDSTRFISPTKTPEYLAAGKRVVSTSVRDVVRTFGETGFVAIADGAADFIAAIETCLTRKDPLHQHRVDRYLAMQSWDRTWARMQALMSRSLSAGTAPGLSRPAHQALVHARPSSTAIPAPTV
jgi:UDP-galactopyranose mutase